MNGKIKQRRFRSKKDELLKKSREAMLAAIQVYNNPLITFKSESFITLAIISWTYLMHAFYKKEAIDYRYYSETRGKKRFDKTKHGAIKHWDLERCLDEKHNPLDPSSVHNLKFLIGIRHEIEHQMTSNIDEFIGAKLQACVLNYNYYIKKLFGQKWSIDKELSMSISIGEIDPTSAKIQSQGINPNVQRFISEFETKISDSITSDKRYSYRILYIPVNANRKGLADKTIQFVKLNPGQEDKIKDIVVFKDREKPKFKPKKIVEIMKSEGFNDFTIHKHTKIWQELKNKGEDLSRFRVQMSDGSYYWYENWIDYVRQFLTKSKTNNTY